MTTTTPIAWFKTTESHKRHGNIHIERYFQLLDNGTISVLDFTRNRFNNQRSFGGLPVTIEPSTQAEWIDKVKLLTNKLQLLYDTN